MYPPFRPLYRTRFRSCSSSSAVSSRSSKSPTTASTSSSHERGPSASADCTCVSRPSPPGSPRRIGLRRVLGTPVEKPRRPACTIVLTNSLCDIPSSSACSRHRSFCSAGTYVFTERRSSLIVRIGVLRPSSSIYPTFPDKVTYTNLWCAYLADIYDIYELVVPQIWILFPQIGI